MSSFKDLSGKKFGRLLVTGISHRKWNKVFWFAECDCGRITTTTTQKLKSGHTKSCGCLVIETSSENGKKARRHGHTCGATQSRTYRSWKAMMRRCHNKGDKDYHRYGGCGIVVCKRWRKFDDFLSDMGERPNNTTIDRINRDKGYFSKNCRWASPTTQTRNSKTCKLTITKVKKILKDRRTQSIIAEDYGISQTLVSKIKGRKVWKEIR